jgi:hypothetical protein
MSIRGEGTVFVPGVTAQEVFDFVLDPAQYSKADTKVGGHQTGRHSRGHVGAGGWLVPRSLPGIGRDPLPLAHA